MDVENMIAKMSGDDVFILPPNINKYRDYKKPFEGSLLTSQYTGILPGF